MKVAGAFNGGDYGRLQGGGNAARAKRKTQTQQSMKEMAALDAYLPTIPSDERFFRKPKKNSTTEFVMRKLFSQNTRRPRRQNLFVLHS